MLSEINNLLSKADLEKIQSMIDDAQWKPGNSSAGAHAREIKSNEEMDQSCKSWTAINQIVVSQLYAHPIFQSMVIPSKVSAAFISRCQSGMYYGQHIDNPIMGGHKVWFAMSSKENCYTILMKSDRPCIKAHPTHWLHKKPNTYTLTC